MPQTIGRYEILEPIGRWAFGVVYKAVDPTIKRILAIKSIELEIPGDSPQYRSFIERLHHEARILSTLSHPNIVTLFDIGEEGGLPYLAMEFVEGDTIAGLLEKGTRFEPEKVIAFASQIASALDYAHGKGIIHGDIKPSNVILFEKDWVKITDFAIAKLFGRWTQSGTLRGTPSYISPEEYRGDKLDSRSDIFSLGVCCFEMLSGERPFPGNSVASILYQIVHVDPIEPANLNSLFPKKWHEVFGKVLAKKPADRYQTAGDFVHDLGYCVGSWLNRNAGLPAPPPPAAAPARIEDSPTMAMPAPPATRIPRTRAPTALTPRPTSAAGSRGGGMVRGVAEAVANALGRAKDLLSRAFERKRPSPAPRPASGRIHERRVRTARSAPGMPCDPSQDPVDATVYAPRSARMGDRFLVQVFAHKPEQGRQAARLAHEFDAQAERRGHKSLGVCLTRGATLTFELHLPGLEVDDPVQALVWNGRPQSVQFGVTVPTDHPPGTVVGTVTASLRSVPIGHLKFKLAVEAAGTGPSPELGPVGDEARRYELVFVSYASKDRAKVLARVQMLEFFKIRYFQDVLSLDPGERWEKALYKHIDECDLFLLFWSTAAKESEWVLKEVRYALDRKRGDELAPPEIKPVVIEGPPPVPPPAELAHLHFNDRLIYFGSAGPRGDPSL